MAEAVAEEYRSSLCDLNFNSKPHINMLTMLAEENVKFAPVIVKTIAAHIEKVPPNLKLPSLYLVDSIMKNIGGQYITLFCDHMITLFSSVFEKVEETTRSSLYKLRQTWNDILPKKILYGIDCNVNHIDPAWPITAKIPPAKVLPPPKSPIHVNPKFLGTPATQASNLSRNPSKPIVTKKNELGTKDKEKEVQEIKKKQEEMLRLIEEKKEQLKALEQKKMEMAAKQKKKNLNLVSSILAQQPPTQKKANVNHRDPRLKKAASSTPAPNDKVASVALQSVVVVPNVKLPVNDVVNNNGNVKSLQKPNVKSEKPNVVGNKTFHGEGSSEPVNRRTDSSSKKTPRGTDESKSHEKPSKDIHSTSREHLDRTSKITNKKHSLNPEEKISPNAKRFCKPHVNKSKRPIPSVDNFEAESHSKNDSHAAKKGKREPARSKNKLNNGPNMLGYGNEAIPGAEQRLETPILFGTEDKDYRQHTRPAVNTNSKQWHQPHTEVAPHPNTRKDPFYPVERKVPDLPTSDPGKKFYPRDAIAPLNPGVRRVPDDNYPSAKMTDFNPDPETDKFLRSEHDHLPKMIDPGPLIQKEQSDQNYPMNPIPVPNVRLTPPPLKQFTLDGVNYSLYFVNEHAFIVKDDNEPREVIFRGPPKNVHIEGLPQPILLGFDGRTIEFDTEGKLNTIRFGTPSREIYINNFPYEAQFGGAPVTVMLEDKQLHRMKIEGPPPQVVVNKPSNELYDLFHHTMAMQPPLGADQSIENSTLLRDVDMRVKPSHNLASSILPESKKDIDWRHVPLNDAPQVPWDVSKNSFETYDHPPGNGRNFQDLPSASLVPNAPTPWNDSNSRIHGDRSAPERNNDMVGGSWPRPGFTRPMMQQVERPPFDPPIQNQRPSLRPPWEMKSTPALQPPPSIPPSLSLSTAPTNLPSLSTLAALSNLPNLNMPPPSWNPLPPPPMFPGKVLDSMQSSSLLAPVSSASNVMQNTGAEPTVPIVPTLPINVETIYEKLVAAGIITKKTATEEARVATPENTIKEENQPDEKDSETKEEIPDPEIFLNPKSLKTYHPHVIFALYKGSQCATCGMRFKEIQSEQYSRHLDWHFRMNRREKDGAKKAYSRRLFYEVKDWIQFKEIEEAEERTPSYFELQADGDSKTEEKEKIQSVLASECETEKCAVCGEQFQLFWVEEEEEWHLRHAVRHDGEAYHPMCYEDFKKAEEMANRVAEEPVKEEQDEKPAEEMDTSSDIQIKVEKDDPLTEEEMVKQEPDETATEDPTIKEEVDKSEPKEEPEDGTSVKKEPEDPSEEDTAAIPPPSEIESAGDSLVPESSESESVEVEEAVAPPQPVEAAAFLSSDIDSDNFEDDFRPPTPDPRFQVLPRVEKGKELSALCTIM